MIVIHSLEFFMPTLIRFFIVILFIAALIYGAMFALVVFVEPSEKTVSDRIPARELFQN